MVIMTMVAKIMITILPMMLMMVLTTTTKNTNNRSNVFSRTIIVISNSYDSNATNNSKNSAKE